jgi:hypothetical protein
MDPDPGGPKTCGSGGSGSGSATLVLDTNHHVGIPCKYIWCVQGRRLPGDPVRGERAQPQGRVGNKKPTQKNPPENENNTNLFTKKIVRYALSQDAPKSILEIDITLNSLYWANIF